MMINIISVYLFISLLYFIYTVILFYKDEHSLARYVVQFVGFDYPEVVAFIALILDSLFWPISMIKKRALK